MIFAIILALVVIVIIIKRTGYSKNYFRPFNTLNNHQRLSDDDEDTEYNDDNVSSDALMNNIPVLSRPQKTMSKRFSNRTFQNAKHGSHSSNTLYYPEHFGTTDNHDGIDDDHSSLDMSVDLPIPPKVVNWEECMR